MLRRSLLRIVESKTPSKESEIKRDLEKATQIIRAGGVVAHATEGGLGPSLPSRPSLSYRKDPENQRSR